MKNSEFGNEMERLVNDRLGEGFSAEFTEVDNENGPQPALVIKEDSGNMIFDTRSWEDAKTHVYPILLETERNRGLLERYLNRPFLNLSVLYYLRTNDSNIDAKTIIKNALLKEWGISEDELHETAIENLRGEFLCKNVKEIISHITEGEEVLDIDISQYVLTNKNCFYGASAVLLEDRLLELAEKLDDDLWIMPSSLHECIAIPTRLYNDLTVLLDMVCKINKKCLRNDEILTDSVYRFSRDTGKVSLAAAEEGVTA